MAFRSTSFDADRLWGTIFIVLYAVMLAVTLIVVFGIGGAIALGGASHHSALPMLATGAIATVIGIVLMATLGLHIAGAIGIKQSRAWGFWLTIGLSVVSLLSSGGATCLTIGPLVYSILRLTGAYGPKPT